MAELKISIDDNRARTLLKILEHMENNSITEIDIESFLRVPEGKRICAKHHYHGYFWFISKDEVILEQYKDITELKESLVKNYDNLIRNTSVWEFIKNKREVRKKDSKK